MSIAQTIEVYVNGEARRVTEGLTVDRLLAELGIDAARVAVELNREIVRQAAWPATSVLAGAQIEVVWFVGGG